MHHTKEMGADDKITPRLTFYSVGFKELDSNQSAANSYRHHW